MPLRRVGDALQRAVVMPRPSRAKAASRSNGGIAKNKGKAMTTIEVTVLDWWPGAPDDRPITFSVEKRAKPAKGHEYGDLSRARKIVYGALERRKLGPSYDGEPQDVSSYAQQMSYGSFWQLPDLPSCRGSRVRGW